MISQAEVDLGSMSRCASKKKLLKKLCFAGQRSNLMIMCTTYGDFDSIGQILFYLSINIRRIGPDGLQNGKLKSYQVTQ